MVGDESGSIGSKVPHMKVVTYVLQGEGYYVIEGNKVEWKKGTAVHAPGPQTVFQRFGTGEVGSQLLRITYGLREKVFQPIVR